MVLVHRELEKEVEGWGQAVDAAKVNPKGKVAEVKPVASAIKSDLSK